MFSAQFCCSLIGCSGRYAVAVDKTDTPQSAASKCPEKCHLCGADMIRTVGKSAVAGKRVFFGLDWDRPL